MRKGPARTVQRICIEGVIPSVPFRQLSAKTGYCRYKVEEGRYFLQEVRWLNSRACLKQMSKKSTKLKNEKANISANEERLHAEAHWLSKLRHPHIIALLCYTHDKRRNCLNLVLEPLFHGTLHYYCYYEYRCKSHFNIPVRIILLQIASACKFLHDHDILHNFINSHSVYIADDSNYKLGNFYYCQEVGEKGVSIDNHVMQIPWMAPDQINADPPQTSSDVYSFGALIWELLAETQPWSWLENVSEIRKRSLSDRFLLPVKMDWPSYLTKLMNLCTSRNASDRPCFDRVVTFLKRPETLEFEDTVVGPRAKQLRRHMSDRRPSKILYCRLDQSFEKQNLNEKIDTMLSSGKRFRKSIESSYASLISNSKQELFKLSQSNIGDKSFQDDRRYSLTTKSSIHFDDPLKWQSLSSLPESVTQSRIGSVLSIREGAHLDSLITMTLPSTLNLVESVITNSRAPSLFSISFRKMSKTKLMLTKARKILSTADKKERKFWAKETVTENDLRLAIAEMPEDVKWKIDATDRLIKEIESCREQVKLSRLRKEDHSVPVYHTNEVLINLIKQQEETVLQCNRLYQLAKSHERKHWAKTSSQERDIIGRRLTTMHTGGVTKRQHLQNSRRRVPYNHEVDNFGRKSEIKREISDGNDTGNGVKTILEHFV